MAFWRVGPCLSGFEILGRLGSTEHFGFERERFCFGGRGRVYLLDALQYFFGEQFEGLFYVDIQRCTCFEVTHFLSFC